MARQLESRKEFQARLTREGRWKDFVAARAKLMREDGMTATAARKVLDPDYGIESAPGGRAESGFPPPGPDGKGAPSGVENAERPEARPPTPEFIPTPQTYGMKRVDFRRAVEWVFLNMSSDPLAVMYSAPNGGALRMLQWVQSSKAAETEFFRTIMPKFAPTKAEMDRDDVFKDDGRVLDDLSVKCLRWKVESEMEEGE